MSKIGITLQGPISFVVDTDIWNPNEFYPDLVGQVADQIHAALQSMEGIGKQINVNLNVFDTWETDDTTLQWEESQPLKKEILKAIIGAGLSCRVEIDDLPSVKALTPSYPENDDEDFDPVKYDEEIDKRNDMIAFVIDEIKKEFGLDE